MFGFLTFGTTLTFLDQAFKARIEKEEKGTFPRELAISKGKIKLYQNHNEGFSFGILKGSRACSWCPYVLRRPLPEPGRTSWGPGEGYWKSWP